MTRWAKRILLFGGGLAIVVAIVRALLPESLVVDVAPATRGPLEVEVREDGQTRVRDRYLIAAPIPGELERIGLDAGTWIESGAVVARIEPARPALLDDRARGEAEARLAVAQARERQAIAAIARARASRTLAADEAARTRKLFAQGAVTGADRDRADTAETLANEDLASAEMARVAAASEARALRAILDPRGGKTETLEVVAPTRGRVLRVLRESAGPVAAGTPLLEVGDPSSLEVVIDVLSRDAERISPGMLVEIGTAATQPARGTVTLVEPAAFTRISALGIEEQRVNVIACFDAPPTIGDGFRVDARIIVWRGTDILRVPASSLFRDHGRWSAYVIVDGRARIRNVDVGHRGRIDVEIVRGLRAGERVITHPSDQIHDGVRVRPRGAPASGSSS